jgi:hypothetical protein
MGGKVIIRICSSVILSILLIVFFNARACIEILAQNT